MSTVLGTCWILALLLDEKAAVEAELCDWELTCVASLIEASELEEETPDLVVVVVVSRWTALDDNIEAPPQTPTGDPGVEGNEAGGEWLYDEDDELEEEKDADVFDAVLHEDVLDLFRLKSFDVSISNFEFDAGFDDDCSTGGMFNFVVDVWVVGVCWCDCGSCELLFLLPNSLFSFSSFIMLFLKVF